MSRQRTLARLSLLCFILAWLPVRPAAAMPAVADANPQPLRVEDADAAGVLLTWQSPPLTLDMASRDGASVLVPRLAGLQSLAAPGEPELPAAAVLLAIPAGATIRIAVLDAISETVDLPAPLARAPAVAAMVPPFAPLPTPVFAAAAPAEFSPVAVVSASAPVRWRSQEVVGVRVNPLQPDAQGRLVVYRHLRIAVRFVGGDVTAHTVVDEGAFEPLLAATIANYAEARFWRRTPDIVDGMRGAPPSGPWLRITTAHAGLQHISCAALAGAGVEVATIDPRSLRLFRDAPGQTEVAVLLDGLAAGCGDAGGLIFYAEAIDTPYTDRAVYWLTYGGAPGLRMDELPAVSAGAAVTVAVQPQRHAVDRLYYSFIPLAENAHHWYWDVLSTATGASRTYTFTVDALTSGPVRLTLDLAGYDGAHRTLVALNDGAAADLAWHGRIARSFDLELDPAQVLAGVNRLTVSAAGGGADYQYMDGFTIAAPQPLRASSDRLGFAEPASGPHRYGVTGLTTATALVADVTDPVRPRVMHATATGTTSCPCSVAFAASGPAEFVVTGRTALYAPVEIAAAGPFTLHDAANQADYLVIAPASVHDALAPLVEQRRAQGLHAQIVDLQTVYDEFGGGEVDPFALRAFLQYTLAVWRPPAPTYVLLVGDGTSDPRGYVDPPLAPGTPAFLRTVDPWLGETASDNQYVTLDDGDNLPQFAVGRFPVSTASAVAALVAKTLRYERQSAPGAWRRRVAVVADNAFDADGVADGAGNFWALADSLVDHAALEQAGYEVDRLYFNPCPAASHPDCRLPDPPYPPYTTAAGLEAALQAALEDGRQVVIYVGHGSPQAWAGGPPLLTAEAAATFANPSRLAVTLEMTCYTGFYHAPRQASLAEALLASSGGAVATWASSGVGVASGHDALARGFLSAVTRDVPLPIGLAAVAGKVELWAAGAGAYRENIDTFHLFGDPALRLAAIESAIYLPWVAR